MKRPTWPADRIERLSELWRAGYSAHAIARELHTHTSTVLCYARDVAGLPPRGRRARKAQQPPKRLRSKETLPPLPSLSEP